MGCYGGEPQANNTGRSGTHDLVDKGLRWVKGLHLANHKREEG